MSAEWVKKANAGDGMFAIAVALLEVAEAINNNKIASSIDDLHDVLRSDHPLQGERFDGIEGALDSMVTTLDNMADKISDTIQMNCCVRDDTPVSDALSSIANAISSKGKR